MEPEFSRDAVFAELDRAFEIARTFGLTHKEVARYLQKDWIRHRDIYGPDNEDGEDNGSSS